MDKDLITTDTDNNTSTNTSTADYLNRFTPAVTDADIAAVKNLSRKQIDELKRKIKCADPAKIFLPANKSGYICPICGNGSGRDGDGIKPTAAVDGYVYHCFKSGDCEGDLLNIIAQINGLDLKKDFSAVLVIGKKIVESAYNGNFDDISIAPPSDVSSDDEDTQTLSIIQSDIFGTTSTAEDIPENERRGLTLDTLNFCKVMWQEKWIHPKRRYDTSAPYPSRRIIIPTSTKSYVAVLPRSDRTRDNKKFWKMDAGKKAVYWIRDKKIITSAQDILLVTEGEIDALSVFQATKHKYLTAAVGGTANYKKILDFLKEKYKLFTDKLLIFVLFDADDAGRTAAKSTVDLLTQNGFNAVDCLLDSKLDANDFLIKHGDAALSARIEEIISGAKSKDAQITGEYDFQIFFRNYFDAEIDKLKKYSKRKTGFVNLDEVQVFLPGIYLLGALPGCGKTTFCWQMANQLAGNGENVIYVTNEMAPFELFIKSLSRELYQRDNSTALTSTDIKLGAYSTTLDAIKNDFKSIKKSLKVLDVRGKNIDDILKSLERYCAGDTDKAPFFFLDYLQIISAQDAKQSEYEKLNDIAQKLKDFQKQTNSTFIIISSFNRANYHTATAMEAFKGSGNLEYTADALLKLAVDIPQGATVVDAMKLQPRNLILSCLKNRNGNFYECRFNYYSAHDFFSPADDGGKKDGKSGV